MGIAERKEREKEQRRQDILDAALTVFARKGMDQATMDDVAETAELSKATLYLYFSGKEELYFALHLRGQDIFYRMVIRQGKTTGNFHEKFLLYLNTLVAFQQKYPDYFEASFHFLTRGISLEKNHLLVKQHNENNRLFMNLWIDLMQEGKGAGIIREELDEVSAAIVFWMQFTGFLKIYPALKSNIKKQYGISNQELVQKFFDFIQSGLFKK